MELWTLRGCFIVMKTKEELIKEAWGNIPKRAKMNDSGWLYFGYSCNGWDDIEGWLDDNLLPSKRELYDLEFYDHDNGDWGSVQIRPKSLQGIENNNGWIKIESEDDLPKEPTECFIYDEDEDILFSTVGIDWINDFNILKEQGVTHYQPIIKPKPPLY